MKKKKTAVKQRNTKARRTAMENKIAMIGISSVVCMLLVVLLFKGSALQRRIDANEGNNPQLQQEMAAEQARTEEIEELQDYMQSDEYTEKIAKEKIGLVKDNEILFKENK